MGDKDANLKRAISSRSRIEKKTINPLMLISHLPFEYKAFSVLWIGPTVKVFVVVISLQPMVKSIPHGSAVRFIQRLIGASRINSAISRALEKSQTAPC